MSKCSNGLVDGIINGMVIGFVVGAALSFFSCCNGRNIGPMIHEGLRWGTSGAVLFGTLGAVRHCL